MRGRGNRERYQVQCFLFIAVVGKIAETLDLRIRPDDLAGFDAFRQLPFELGRNARVTGIAPVDVPLRIRLQTQRDPVGLTDHQRGALGDQLGLDGSWEARRVGNECVSTCRSRWAPYN